MLRVITSVLIMSVSSVYGQGTGYIEPDTKVMENARIEAARQLDQAEQILKRGDNAILNKVLENRSIVNDVPSTLDKGSSYGINLPYKHNREDTRKLVDVTENANLEIKAAEQGRQAYGALKPIVFVSFSMPDDLIREYMREGKVTDSMVVIRGMYKNDLNKTMKRISELVGGDKTLSGVAIDPTLFNRFDIKNVPAFVLPVEQVARCLSSDCKTPEHVKATGDMSIRYFLERVQTTGTAVEKAVASELLSHY